ncbi:hypothetical protein [Kordiimonas sp. SCSIO 12610]|uniref:hypothetical protein n=1 Tax=Kordiimonas sp. SCSIO 12610 TaxID=2829597 RepID=UPI00210B2B79|nr:hypothetical protein [Kordiimonas sp. SCSIO 12610]UTW54748.1 hypothetical protein KFF44_13180 [Kordiimonas sp. SCSIO 12610]
MIMIKKASNRLFAYTATVLTVIMFFTAPTLAQQTQADAFTRYELLAPTSQSFRIYYYVSATREGATRFYNQIRPGSEPDVHGVYDRMSGENLNWAIVDGNDAKGSGLIPNAQPDFQYIRVDLNRPVPNEGRGRLLIDKTYKDAKSYFEKDGTLIFSRTLGVKRNSVILPLNYELISVNYPSQVILREDGRLELSFINPGTIGVPYEVKARPIQAGILSVKLDKTSTNSNKQTSTRDVARVDYDIPQRASQTRDIFYFLQEPESNSFRLYHDYEEKREGIDRYLNVVRPGSKASNPSAKILDTGEVLKVETLHGEEITNRGIDIGEPVTNKTELVAIWFDPVETGQSKLLRIEETYTDAGRYFLTNKDEFLWDRSFGRSRNTVILPAGWVLTESSIPASVNMRQDGRTQLNFVNGRPDNIEVLIRGRRR